MDLRFLDMWQLGDNVTVDSVEEYFSGAKLGWMKGHYKDLTWCIAERVSEQPPYKTAIPIEYPNPNPMCKPNEILTEKYNAASSKLNDKAIEIIETFEHGDGTGE